MLRTLKFLAPLALLLSGCGSVIQSSSTRSETESCITQIPNFDSQGAELDSEGRATAKKDNGQDAFLIKTTWKVDGNGALKMRDAVNEVTLEFFKPNGSAAASVSFDEFHLVMDMGSHAHTTDECFNPSPEVSIFGNKVTIKKINFVMSTRSINKWFFHDLTATVDSVEGKVSRLNVPHKVQ